MQTEDVNSAQTKKWFSWIAVIIGLTGVAVSYWGVYVLLAYYAAGLVWWATWALFFSGPLAGVGAAVAFFPPRQRAASAAGLLGAAAWLILWVLCLTVFGFEFGGASG